MSRVKPTASSLVLTALAAGALLGGACGLGGCASSGSSDVGHYIVVPPQTPIFRYGPAQSFGPDFNLTQGQHVVMLRREFGYSRIMTDDGQSGYVATEDLAPAPPPAKPAPVGRNMASTGRFTPLPPRGTARPGISSANNRVLDSGPLFGSDDLPPLPEHGPADEPAPPRRTEERKPEGSKPEFRYPKPKTKPGFRVNIPHPENKP